MARLGQLLTPPTSYDNSHEAAAAVVCADSDNPASPRDWPPAAHAADRQAPYFGSPFAYTSFACADWKVRDRDRYAGPFNRPTANPILVVGTTFDPATPYAGAVALTHDLANARLLTLNGWGHTALGQPSTCAHEAEVRYLVDLTLPALGRGWIYYPPMAREIQSCSAGKQVAVPAKSCTQQERVLGLCK